jgi:hypothetical protein
MRLASMILALFFLSPFAAHAACSIEQRIELSKAGYDKNEIENLCNAPSQPADTKMPTAAVATSRSSIVEMLGKGSIEAASGPGDDKRRCQPQESGVMLKKGLTPYEQLRYSAKTKVNPQAKEMLMVILLDSGFNTNFCVAMRVDKWKYGNNLQAFNADVSKYQAEFDALVSGLKELGVREN